MVCRERWASSRRIGAAAGVALSLVVLPLFGTLLFGVTPTDATTYAVVLTLACGRGGARVVRAGAPCGESGAVDRVATGVVMVESYQSPKPKGSGSGYTPAI